MSNVGVRERARILVVDDDALQRELLVEFLGGRGYDVESTEDGEKAWNLLKRQSEYDLVITDLDMPVMNGLQLIDRVRKQALPVEVILRTGFTMYEVAKRTRNLTGLCVLTKPHDIKDLVQSVELALMGRVDAGKEVKSMRKRTSIVIAALATLLFATPQFAASNPANEPVAGQYASSAGTELPMSIALKIFSGKVVSVDHDAKTLTVKKTGWLRAQAVTFAVEDEAVYSLADLTQDDWVNVTYAEADDKLIAKTIVKRSSQGGDS